MSEHDYQPQSEVIEAFIIDPFEMPESDWDVIHENAKKYACTGERDWLKCCVLGYLEWANVDVQKLRRQ